ncbi:methionine aminopeptidase [Candidatus Xenohaliotis californiensis]|uniref:Methionine aminopeptidase n=1 Tax=Candidatus Xenohaliotis californiensis TaxID=84677 RepID=A0ABP0EUQ7_9RICK|nr:methionine aminopeptidase [Candidatus Xenohaliotis californiensis]
MNDQIILHKKDDFKYMQEAGKLAAEVLDYITETIDVGISTNHLNDLCYKKIISAGAIPAPLNYKGFPKSICTSINHVVCHGIPSDKLLQSGDILNIDITVILNGWHGDSSRMYIVGKPSIMAKRLIKVTYESMMLGIEQAKPGNTTGDIAYATQSHVEKHGYSVVRDYCGHGIGKFFHGPPNVPFYGKPTTGTVLKEGMFFTIEPMVNVGSHHTKLNIHDGWTVTTKDRKLSAQFEHTIGITNNGCEIFTLSPKELHCPPCHL